MTTQAAGAAQANDSNAPGIHKEKARTIVRHNLYWAIGGGLLPIPILDFVALTAVQVKMLKELSALYEVNFLEQKAQKIVGSLITGMGSLALTEALAGSLFKLVPVAGQIVGAVGVPLLGGALTLAMGNLFIMHFESGGTLLTFDADKMRAHFRKEVEASRSTVKKMQSEKADPLEPPAP